MTGKVGQKTTRKGADEAGTGKQGGMIINGRRSQRDRETKRGDLDYWADLSSH